MEFYIHYNLKHGEVCAAGSKPGKKTMEPNAKVSKYLGENTQFKINNLLNGQDVDETIVLFQVLKFTDKVVYNCFFLQKLSKLRLTNVTSFRMQF